MTTLESGLRDAEPSPPSGKSPDAFRTIAEVAVELDVPQHVLRFWETRFPQVKPLKRGGGRRYYRPRDIATLRRIRDLLYAKGYTIRGAQRVLKENGGRQEAGEASAGGDRARLSPEVRAELQAVMDELEALRRLIGDS